MYHTQIHQTVQLPKILSKCTPTASHIIIYVFFCKLDYFRTMNYELKFTKQSSLQNIE
jgi:hypothetical protein